MIWVLFALVCVVGVKYYTALGSRSLERRLNRVKRDLDTSKQNLKAHREKFSETSQEEEEVEQRVRFAKEMIEDLKLRLNSKEEKEPQVEPKEEPAVPAFMRF